MTACGIFMLEDFQGLFRIITSTFPLISDRRELLSLYVKSLAGRWHIHLSYFNRLKEHFPCLMTVNKTILPLKYTISVVIFIKEFKYT